MCGVIGIAGDISPQAEERVERMAASITHRGPDDSGVWRAPTAPLVLGHRRLSILDLSPLGRQPMESSSGRYVISFNGEVYNFREVRSELLEEGHEFRGGSDTEVMLAACEQWGVVAAVERFQGMFAFALWDKKEKALFLVCDRIGIKPMYYGWQNNVLFFGSDLRAFAEHPRFAGSIDRQSLALFFEMQYVPGPYSIWEGFYKLPPGTILRVPESSFVAQPHSFSPFRDEGKNSPQSYWSAEQVVADGHSNPFEGEFEDAVEALEELLIRSVEARLVADVPLGALLSGGVDSSLIVALMQKVAAQKTKTYAIGFFEKEYDEASHARAVAEHLGTDHTELYVTPKQALEVIPRIPEIYAEPFGDASQVPTFLVSQLARKEVTVALSGDGGDELFCGYNRYIWADTLWRFFGVLPLCARQQVAKGIRLASPGTWDRFVGVGQHLFPRSLAFHNPGEKIHKLACILDLPDKFSLYAHLVTHWDDGTALVRGARKVPTALSQRKVVAPGASFKEGMMALDLVSYLPDDILTKVDRASMAVSLETRVPLLDHRVIEFSCRLPLAYKYQRGETKRVLRAVLRKYVPDLIIDRPKMGFGVPVDHWLRGPLRDWGESLLEKRKLAEQGLLHAELVHEKWQEHLSGKRSWQYLLWDVLMFQAWYEHTINS